MSLSVQILDLYDDLNGVLLKDVAASAPEFVKTAQIATREDLTKLPKDAFALHALTKEGSKLNKFPIHTAADTWMSCSYFEKNAHKLPYQARKIAATHLKTACARFNLQPNSALEMYSVPTELPNSYVEEFDSLRKVASQAVIEERPTEGKYALPGRYPLFHEGHIKQATSYFEEYHKNFAASERHEFATNVLQRASELGVDVSSPEFEPLKKTAGTAFGDRVEAQINLRRKIVDGDVDATVNLEKVAMAKDQIDASKFACLLAAWDIENSMDRLYGKTLVDPYEATYDTISKEAGYVWEDSKSGETLTGSELEKAASDKYDKIKGYFGETLANSLKKHGSQIFESLPIDAKSVIAKIAKGNI